MKIAICEDNPEEAQWLEQIIWDWIQWKRGQNAEEAEFLLQAEVVSYTSAEAFLFAYEERLFDVLFLDIQMSGEDGLSLARRLRDSGDSVYIVFVTGLEEHMPDGYEIEAIHYLLKPVEREKVFESLDRIRKKMNRKEPEVVLQTESGLVKILLREIVKVEVCGRKCVYTVWSRSMQRLQEYTVTETFREARKRLEKAAFLSCYRGILVNVRYIEVIRHDSLLLQGGLHVPVSRRKYQELNQAFIRYCAQQR